MQTQLLPLGNLVHMAQGRDVEMVLVDGEIVVEDACPLKADRMPSDATQTPRSQVRAAARDHNPVRKRICASWFGCPRGALTAPTSMALACRWEESSTASKAGAFLFR